MRADAFKAPTGEERRATISGAATPVVPRTGEIAVWNRSHYEDVLVPVVEGWIDKAEAKRRYAQINDFERLLVRPARWSSSACCTSSKDEQRERLQARIDTPGKQWKFSMGDLEVRAKWRRLPARLRERRCGATSTQAPWL